jgi:Transposase DDE domain
MSGVATESLLAAGYGLFLVLVALGIDVLARHSHRRSELYRTAGFTYHEHLDAWECPEGERLHRIETDIQQRLSRYRAPAQICNACPRKDDCTESDTGREITRTLDPWPHSEAGRFHRVIAIAIVCFGILVIGAGAALHHGAGDLAVLGVALLVSTAVGLYLLADFRSAPSGFPWAEGEQSGPAPAPPQAGRSPSSIL